MSIHLCQEPNKLLFHDFVLVVHFFCSCILFTKNNTVLGHPEMFCDKWKQLPTYHCEYTHRCFQVCQHLVRLIHLGRQFFGAGRNDSILLRCRGRLLIWLCVVVLGRAEAQNSVWLYGRTRSYKKECSVQFVTITCGTT